MTTSDYQPPKLIGASVWEQALYEQLTSHERAERELLVEYEKAAASSSAAVRFLTGLILEDERRHHSLFRDLAATLRSDVELRPTDATIPPLDHLGPDADLAEIVTRLIAHERADRRELRRLARELANEIDTTMWPLLVDLMRMDTEKHIAILEFVRRHARG
jgi:rubrerythrin